MIINELFRMNKTLLKKFLSFSYGNWIGLIIGFFGTMLTTRIFIPEDFGKASMFTLVLNILVIVISFGTDQSFVRFFYEESPDNRGGLLYNSIKIPLVLLTVLTILMTIFNRKISLWIFEEESIGLIVFLSIGIFSQFLYRYSTLVIRMQQKGKLYSNIHVLQKILEIVTLIVLYFIYGNNYKILIFTTVINTIVLSSIGILIENNFWNIKNICLENLVHSKKEIIQFGSPIVITVLITWLFQSFDKLAIRYWNDFNELGLYSAAFKIVALVNVLQSSFSTFWTPIAYEKFINEPEDRVFFNNIFKIVSFSMFFIAITSIAGKDLIVYMLGSDYRQASNIMPFLVFMPVMYTLSEVTVVGINFKKQPKWHILIASISCMTNIIGNYLLVPEFGAIGASVSTAFSYVIFFLLRTQISQKYFKVYYNLKKTYLMILFIIIYAYLSILTEVIYLNILIGLSLIIILVILYYKDIKNGYKILTKVI